MKPLSRSLIEAARPAERPTDADRARVRARVMAKVASAGAGALALGAAGDAAAKAAVTAGVTAGASAGLVKAIVVGTLAGLCVVGTAEVIRAPSPPAHPIATPALAASAAPIAQAPAAATVPAPPASVPAPEPPPARIDLPRTTGSAGLREEVELLKEAQRALAAGETDRALGLLGTHAERFHGGALTEERLAAQAIALCQSGRRDAARGALSRFLAEAKASPLEPRVREACARVAEEDGRTERSGDGTGDHEARGR